MKARAIIVMGVSGSGKTSVGKALAAASEIPFIDGDDLHSQSNISKMEQGLPLTDEDRFDWFNSIIDAATKMIAGGTSCVFACSALKKKYREKLRNEIDPVCFVYLKASYERVYQHLLDRKGHFMPVSLLKNQFDILEEPGVEEEDVITIEVTDKLYDTVSATLQAID
ncbi:gluconokinase [Niabella ginsengisoli]|uniref:Gluconokinase n=1 Tax=Niabella ginsengisoli TaxID=522298 RepID=A0ABS9SJP7_9BACT|nr:gluconokinase [Niabella ginsengisoli]MCH5598612.1 gluconokinase [Niabella ginsengisoli]